ncbi:hypothetical protein HMPREF9120_02491 [Neisseria sp. oral taxon 020 str. F0370]|nr:hypothetical protein HMPREF9120_02491 [Neisseria sp. oral taxon 020 str. F0370]
MLDLQTENTSNVGCVAPPRTRQSKSSLKRKRQPEIQTGAAP